MSCANSIGMWVAKCKALWGGRESASLSVPTVILAPAALGMTAVSPTPIAFSSRVVPAARVSVRKKLPSLSSTSRRLLALSVISLLASFASQSAVACSRPYPYPPAGSNAAGTGVTCSDYTQPFDSNNLYNNPGGDGAQATTQENAGGQYGAVLHGWNGNYASCRDSFCWVS